MTVVNFICFDKCANTFPPGKFRTYSGFLQGMIKKRTSAFIAFMKDNSYTLPIQSSNFCTVCTFDFQFTKSMHLSRALQQLTITE